MTAANLALTNKQIHAQALVAQDKVAQFAGAALLFGITEADVRQNLGDPANLNRMLSEAEAEMAKLRTLVVAYYVRLTEARLQKEEV